MKLLLRNTLPLVLFLFFNAPNLLSGQCGWPTHQTSGPSHRDEGTKTVKTDEEMSILEYSLGPLI